MLSINKFIVLAFAALCGSMVNAQNTVMRTPVSVWLTAAPLGDCRQQYYQLAIDNSTQLSYLCNESSGAWTGSAQAGVVVAAGKTLTASNTLTLAGTDGTTETFPSTSATIARTDAANTFTGVQTLSSAPVLSTSTLTAGSSLITFPAATITVPGTVLTDCSSSASCASPTTRSSIMKVVTGTIAFSAATTASVTGISPTFTAATSYTCSVYNPSHNYTWNFTTQTTSGFTITAGTSNSDTWSYSCVGY